MSEELFSSVPLSVLALIYHFDNSNDGGKGEKELQVYT